jgi:YVTN family beta-propeller protein
VNVGTNPLGVAVNPAGTKVYVANQGSNVVSVIDTTNNTVIDKVDVGRGPVAFGQFIGPLTTPTII